MSHSTRRWEFPYFLARGHLHKSITAKAGNSFLCHWNTTIELKFDVEFSKSSEWSRYLASINNAPLLIFLVFLFCNQRTNKMFGLWRTRGIIYSGYSALCTKKLQSWEKEQIVWDDPCPLQRARWANAQRTNPGQVHSLFYYPVVDFPGIYAMLVNWGTEISYNFSEACQTNKLLGSEKLYFVNSLL